MTPRLADNTVGLMTTGNDDAIEQRHRGSAAAGTVMNDGVGSPAAFSFSRDRRLSRAAARRFRRMARQPEQARQVRGQHRRPIADREHGVDRTRLERLQHGIDRAPFFVIAHGNRAVAPGIVELIAAVGGVEELDAQRRRRVGEHPRLIAGGRGEQQDALSELASAPDLTS